MDVYRILFIGKFDHPVGGEGLGKGVEGVIVISVHYVFSLLDNMKIQVIIYPVISESFILNREGLDLDSSSEDVDNLVKGENRKAKVKIWNI